jgi:hypothetical protein
MATTATLGIGVMAKIIHQGSRFTAQVVTPLAIYSCTGMRDAQREPLLKAAMQGGALMRIKSVRLDAHERSDTCVVHGADVCVSSAEIG